MLKLLDIPKGWFAQFMFKRALESSAKDMEVQAYMQGKRTCKTICTPIFNHDFTRFICISLISI